MSREHRLDLGKIDYNNSGRKNCRAVITWSLENNRFSMYAEIWNPRETDIYCGGQCVDHVASYFPHNKKVQRMLAIWQEWNLNDMTAGSPAQEKFLKENPINDALNHYNVACAALADAGLDPDPNYIHNGKPYKYGSAWLTRTIPADVIAEIQSW